MASEHIHVVDPPLSVYVKLWLLALAGLAIPSGVAYFWPDMGWVGQTERALQQSLEEQQWIEPWQPIDQKSFSSGWVRCASLEDAVKLDQQVDDGHLHTGRLVLSEGGLAWRAP
ncbi:MAG: hypothetical protein AB3N64_11935 [Puniceicoccaceae bacterium]